LPPKLRKRQEKNSLILSIPDQGVGKSSKMVFFPAKKKRRKGGEIPHSSIFKQRGKEGGGGTLFIIFFTSHGAGYWRTAFIGACLRGFFCGAGAASPAQGERRGNDRPGLVSGLGESVERGAMPLVGGKKKRTRLLYSRVGEEERKEGCFILYPV